MTFSPSPQQQAFFTWIEQGQGNLILEAVAGAGKTTTLIQGLTRMQGSTFFGAYNKKIADEIKAKAIENDAMRDDLRIGTMHAAGMGAWLRVFPNVKVDKNKVDKMIEAAIAADLELLPMLAHKEFVAKMVSFGKQFLMGVKRKADNLCVWKKLMLHFSMEQDLPEDTDVDEVFAFVIRIFSASAHACQIVIDFDDMIYAPVAFKARMFRNDWVLIDECQDLNGARRELARMMLKPGGRLVAVGDSCQAIYGFTGAGADSVKLIAQEFNCARLPLTVTYRCPKAVVAYVHQWVKHIQAHPSAPEGSVISYKPGKDDPAAFYLQNRPSPSDAILCRYSAPLIRTAYSMLRDGIACKVEGRDIGNGLIKLARRWKIRSLDALENRLATYLAREQKKAGEKNLDSTPVEDRVATLQIFIDRCRAKSQNRIEDLVVEIESLFADDVTGVTVLSTGHKSKGREWDRVYWLQAALRNKRPLQAWEADQERNINYVISTRAKAELILIPEAFH